MTRFLVPILFGLIGAAVLVSLGVWQVQRLSWKEGVLAQIEAEIAADPVAVPAVPNADSHRFLPVRLSGAVGAETLRVLMSTKSAGAGYRLISAIETEGGRRLLLDRGFIRVSQEMPAAPQGVVEVIGNLHWPDDRNSSTPENDVEDNTWFARDLGPMAAALGTEPFLVVVKDMRPAEAGITPMPVDTAGIPNDHLEYAVTWFGLALVWLGMTGFYIWRLAGQRKGRET